MTLDDLVWSKRVWEQIRNGGTWAIPQACVVMQRTPTGFSLYAVMPFLSDMRVAAEYGADVPRSAAELLAYQKRQFDFIRGYFETAGLDFDDPKGLLTGKGIASDTNGSYED